MVSLAQDASISFLSRSIRQSMRTRRPTPTSGPADSTVQIDVEEMDIDGVSLRVYDCAGQVNTLSLSSLELEICACSTPCGL